MISKYISGAREIEFDAVAHKGQLVNYAISEHVEDSRPGVPLASSFAAILPCRCYVLAMSKTGRATPAVGPGHHAMSAACRAPLVLPSRRLLPVARPPEPHMPHVGRRAPPSGTPAARGTLRAARSPAAHRTAPARPARAARLPPLRSPTA